MKPQKIRWEFTEYVGAYEISAQVEEINFESYALTIYIDDTLVKDLSMGSLGLCKQYVYGFVEGVHSFAKIIKEMF